MKRCSGEAVNKKVNVARVSVARKFFTFRHITFLTSRQLKPKSVEHEIWFLQMVPGVRLERPKP